MGGKHHWEWADVSCLGLWETVDTALGVVGSGDTPCPPQGYSRKWFPPDTWAPSGPSGTCATRNRCPLSVTLSCNLLMCKLCDHHLSRGLEHDSAAQGQNAGALDLGGAGMSWEDSGFFSAVLGTAALHSPLSGLKSGSDTLHSL